MVFRNTSAAAALLLLLVASASAYISSPLEVRLEGPVQPKSFSGSPPLLQSLAGKEEVIYELLKDLAADLHKVSGNDVKVDTTVQGQINNITS